MKKKLFSLLLAVTLVMTTMTTISYAQSADLPEIIEEDWGDDRKELDPTEYFVYLFYKNILNRDYDIEGFNYWVDLLKSREKTAANVADFFIFSEEFELQEVSNEEFVKRIYLTFLDREADEGGLDHWVDLLDKGVTRRSVIFTFIDTEEFWMMCQLSNIEKGQPRLIEPADQVNNVTMFVFRCYTETLGRKADKAGLNYWTGLLLDKACTPQDLAETFLFADEFQLQNHDNNSFIKVLYRTFMGREADALGLSYWNAMLDDGMSRERAVTEFSHSLEFYMIIDDFGL